MKLLDDPNREIRYAAVLTLSRLGPSRLQAIPALMAALEEDASTDEMCVEVSIINLLGKLGPPGRVAVPALKKLFEDPDSMARVEAALALWRLS